MIAYETDVSGGLTVAVSGGQSQTRTTGCNWFIVISNRSASYRAKDIWIVVKSAE